MSGATVIAEFYGQVSLVDGDVTTPGYVTVVDDGFYVEAGELRLFVDNEDVIDVLDLDANPHGQLEEAS